MVGLGFGFGGEIDDGTEGVVVEIELFRTSVEGLSTAGVDMITWWCLLKSCWLACMHGSIRFALLLSTAFIRSSTISLYFAINNKVRFYELLETGIVKFLDFGFYFLTF
jgi:hypothetical protein